MGPHLGRTRLAVCFTVVLVGYVCADEKRQTVKAKEGEAVTLNAKKPGSNKHTVVWTFGTENSNICIAKVREGEVKTDFSEHFRDRLQVDSQTGALTITQLRISDSGIYMYQSISSSILSQHFHLNVYGSVCTPSIKVDALLVNTNCKVTADCYVENSKELTLFWYRGRERLTNMSSPDVSSRLSLVLEIEPNDADNYSCVAQNPVEEKATKVPTEDTCPKDRETSSWCQTEATVRLVISAVVGMALIVLVVDHVRPRR